MSPAAMPVTTMPSTTMPVTAKPPAGLDAGWTPRAVAAVGAPCTEIRHPRLKASQGQ
jgi:hypothetical protein